MARRRLSQFSREASFNRILYMICRRVLHPSSAQSHAHKARLYTLLVIASVTCSLPTCRASRCELQERAPNLLDKVKWTHVEFTQWEQRHARTGDLMLLGTSNAHTPVSILLQAGTGMHQSHVCVVVVYHKSKESCKPTLLVRALGAL